MSPDQVRLLRRLALSDPEAMSAVMGGRSGDDVPLDPRTGALIRIVALMCVDSHPTTFRWATELGIAAGLGDDDIFGALYIVAPVIGQARLTATLPNLMAALDLDVVDA